MRIFSKIVRLLLIIISINLLIIGVQHFYIAKYFMRNPGYNSIMTENNVPSINYPTHESISLLPKSYFEMRPGELPLVFVGRILNLVHTHTYNCKPWDFRLSWIEYFLFENKMNLLQEGILYINRFYCGFCHQRALIFSEILQSNGIKAEVYGLGGHVVAKVYIGESAYYADPDYGVAPFSLGTDPWLAYKRARWDNADAIKKLYDSAFDNESYGSGIFQISEYQKEKFILADVLAYCALVLAIFVRLAARSAIFRGFVVQTRSEASFP